MINLKTLTGDEFNEFVAVLEEINEEGLGPEAITRLKEDLSGGLYNGFLLYEENDLAGLAVTVNTYSAVHARKILYLDELYVRKEYRRKGLGKILFDHVVEYARKEGYMRVEWRTAKDNAEAQSLYSHYETETDWVYYLLKL